MTPADFCQWLQGFRDAGGTDIDVILAKAREIEQAANKTTLKYEWYPVSPRPLTAPITSEPLPYPIGEIICASGLQAESIVSDEGWPAWPSRAQ